MPWHVLREAWGHKRLHSLSDRGAAEQPFPTTIRRSATHRPCRLARARR